MSHFGVKTRLKYSMLFVPVVSPNLSYVIKIIAFILDYFKYYSLTGLVVFPYAAILFILLNIRPDFSFSFFSFFAFLNPAYETGTFRMGIPEVMQIFSLVSLVTMLGSYAFDFVLKEVFNVTFVFSGKLRTVFYFSIISLIYVVAGILISLDNSLGKSFYYIFALFYFVNLVSLALYSLLDALVIKLFNFNKNLVSTLEK